MLGEGLACGHSKGMTVVVRQVAGLQLESGGPKLLAKARGAGADAGLPSSPRRALVGCRTCSKICTST